MMGLKLLKHKWTIQFKIKKFKCKTHCSLLTHNSIYSCLFENEYSHPDHIHRNYTFQTKTRRLSNRTDYLFA